MNLKDLPKLWLIAQNSLQSQIQLQLCRKCVTWRCFQIMTQQTLYKKDLTHLLKHSAFIIKQSAFYILDPFCNPWLLHYIVNFILNVCIFLCNKIDLHNLTVWHIYWNLTQRMQGHYTYVTLSSGITELKQSLLHHIIPSRFNHQK